MTTVMTSTRSYDDHSDDFNTMPLTCGGGRVVVTTSVATTTCWKNAHVSDDPMQDTLAVLW